MAKILIERDAHHTTAWGYADFSVETLSPPPARIARLVRRRPSRSSLFSPTYDKPRSWEIWATDEALEGRFTSWPAAKAALRRAIEAGATKYAVA